MSRKLGIIGCGKMGYALLKGISQGFADSEKILVCDTSDERIGLFVQEFNAIPANNEELIANANTIFLAVKPNQIKGLISQTKTIWTTEKLLVSIAAGIKTSTIEKELGKEVPVVRVMPNTPCLVGEGVSALSAGSFARPADLELVQSIVNQLGISVIVDETDMDAITAISGSGPAYAFLVVESLMDAALSLGLSSETARRLVLQTIKGSIAMLESTGEHPAVLKAQVSSPGGTTIAGLRELEAGGVREAFFAAAERACQRSIDLGAI